MKYSFTEDEKKTLNLFNFPFSPFKDLREGEEDMILDALLDRFGTDSEERYEKVYQHMAEQA